MLGGWTGWMLGSGGAILRRPWIWAIRFLLSGGDGVVYKDKLVHSSRWVRWRRLILLAYWGGTIIVAVGGWQTHLVRARRIRMRNAAKSDIAGTSLNGSGTSSASTTLNSNASMPMSTDRKVNGSGGTLGTTMTQGSVELKAGSKVGIELAREEKRVHASLNMRRKFFHALAVVMFVPGIAIDVSLIARHAEFTHQVDPVCPTACLHFARLFGRLRSVHLLGVRSVLCAVSRRSTLAHLLL